MSIRVLLNFCGTIIAGRHNIAISLAHIEQSADEMVVDNIDFQGVGGKVRVTPACNSASVDSDGAHPSGFLQYCRQFDAEDCPTLGSVLTHDFPFVLLDDAVTCVNPNPVPDRLALWCRRDQTHGSALPHPDHHRKILTVQTDHDVGCSR